MKARIALILFMASISGAHAATMQWQASGQVTNTFAYEPGQPGSFFGSGQFRVTLTFDDAAVDSDPSSTRGSFGSLMAVDILLDGQDFHQFYGGYSGSFVPDAQSALIVGNDLLTNGVYTDSLSIAASDVRIWDGSPWANMPLNNFSLQLAHQSDVPSSLLTSDGIPGAWPDLQQFETRTMQISGVYSSTDLYWFEVSVDTFQPVPVPAAAWLMFSGLGLLGVSRRKAPRR